MARTRKRTPYDPGKIHDRRAKELPRQGRFVEVDVDDPWDPGATIRTVRAIRDDPLGQLLHREHIDQAQFDGGRAFQRDFETAERGARAIDPSKEAVDGGVLPEPITEAQRKAARSLARAFRELGADGASLMHDFLIDGYTMRLIAQRRGFDGQRWDDYFGVRVRECLHCLAFVYGFAKEPSGRKRLLNKMV